MTNFQIAIIWAMLGRYFAEINEWNTSLEQI